jgi:hypothetical protein
MGNASVKSHSGRKHSGHKHSGHKHSGHKHRYGGGLSPLNQNPGHTKTAKTAKKTKQTPLSRVVIVKEANRAETTGIAARAAKAQAALDKEMRLKDFFASVDESYQKDMRRHFTEKRKRSIAAAKKDREFEIRRTERRTRKN